MENTNLGSTQLNREFASYQQSLMDLVAFTTKLLDSAEFMPIDHLCVGAGTAAVGGKKVTQK